MRLSPEKMNLSTIVGSGERMWVLNLRTLQTSRVRRITHIHCIGGETPQSPKVNLSRRSEDARELSLPLDLRYSQIDVDHFRRTEIW
jgi:hypothetical protein